MFLCEKAIRGGRRYWIWVGFLLAVAASGLVAYLRQLQDGLGVTGLSRDVTWGLYIAQFTFLTGIAASAAVIVLPYYVRKDASFGRIAILSQFLAVAAVTAGLLFVFVDMGQPARVLNVLLYPAPGSIMFWDMIALLGYLVLNIVITVATLRAESSRREAGAWIKALVLVSIPWALAMRTVSALLYSGLAGRSFWLTATMAPRALASAFAAGPALLILVCLLLARLAGFDAGREALRRLAMFAGAATLANLFFLFMEFFTVFYSRIPEPMEHFEYILLGRDGNYQAAPWMWLSLGLAGMASVLLLMRRLRDNQGLLAAGCVMVLAALWIEKSILLTGGFVPSPLGAVATYFPTAVELLVTLGIWAVGMLMITVFYKIALSVRENLPE